MEVKDCSVLRMDLQSLISCIQCHKESEHIEVTLETLRTIVDICSNESVGKDAFREEGGLEFLLDFLSYTSNTILLEHSLKTLASVIDGNIHSQMHLTGKSTFEIIQVILRKETFSGDIHKNALLLISAIVYQNNAAQTLLYETGIIKDLLNMYHSIYGFVVSGTEHISTEVWLALNSVISFSVNNPQNEKNQEICSVLFEPSLRILEYSSSTVIISSACSFLSLCISNNVRNQDSFAECDGLLILKRSFQKYFDCILLEAKECNSIFRRGTFQVLNNIVGVISAAATNHDKNAGMLGKLGVLSLMIELLFIDKLDIQLKARLILSLGHCVEACCNNKSYLLETENFDVLLKKNLEIGNEELTSACKCLLQACLLVEGCENNEQDFHDEMAILFDKRNITEFTNLNSDSDNKCFQARTLDYVNSQSGMRRPNNTVTRSGLNQDSSSQFESHLKGSFPKNTDDTDSITKRHHSVTLQDREGYSCKLLRQTPRSKANRLPLSRDRNFDASPAFSDIKPKMCETPQFHSNVFDFSGKSNASRKRMLVDFHERSSKMHCSEGFNRVQSSSVTPQKTKLLTDFEAYIKKRNRSLNQSFSDVNSVNCTPKQKRNITKSSVKNVPFASNKSIADSFNSLKKSALSDRTNLKPTEYQHLKKVDLDLFPLNTTESYFGGSCKSLKKDPSIFEMKPQYGQSKRLFTQNCSSNFLYPNIQMTAEKKVDCISSASSHYERLRKASYQGCKFNECTSKHSGAFNNAGKYDLDKENLSASQSTIDVFPASHLNRSMNFNETCSSNYMKVVVFPGKICEDHGLISSFEMLRVVPIDEEDLL